MVVTAMRGIRRPLARNASVTRDPTAEGATHQGSSIRSASVVFRRLAIAGGYWIAAFAGDDTAVRFH